MRKTVLEHVQKLHLSIIACVVSCINPFISSVEFRFMNWVRHCLCIMNSIMSVCTEVTETTVEHMLHPSVVCHFTVTAEQCINSKIK